MSRLIFEGDTVNTFGKFLPVPFIERIYVEDEDFRVRISLYIQIADDEDESEFAAQSALEELTYYVAIVNSSGDRTHKALQSGDMNALGLARTSKTGWYSQGWEYVGPLIDVETYFHDEDSLEDFNSTISILTGLPVENYWEKIASDYKLYGVCPDCMGGVESFSFDDFNYVGVHYNSEGQKLLKYTVDTTSESAFGTYGGAFYYAFNGNMVAAYYDEEADDYDMYFIDIEGLGDIRAYAWSSTKDYDADQESVDEMFDAGQIILLNQNVSNISYEKIFEPSGLRGDVPNGEIVGQAEQVWATADGAPYNDIPLQTIMLKYYTTDGITHEEITDSFNELVEEYTTETESDSSLESVLDSISFILSTFGTEPDLLPRLNTLRKAWPSKSSVTTVGKVYGRFKNKLRAAVAAVKKGRPLKKILIHNPKIIDLRNPTYEGWEQREIDEAPVSLAWQSEYLYYSWGTATQDPWSLSAQTYYTGDEAEDVAEGLVYTGFFFLDIEKIIHNASNIARIYDVEKLESYFGKQITSSRLRYISDMEWRRSIEGSDTYPFSVQVTFPAIAEAEGARSVRTKYNLWDSYDTGETHLYDKTSAGTTLNSFIRTRNWEPAVEDQGDYRLLCFEFQDVQVNNYTQANMSHIGTEGAASTALGGWSYSAQLTMKDNTHRIITALTDNYSNIMESYAEYVLLAQEACSFNNTDGVFNKFFVEGMSAAYEDNMGEAPWAAAPLLWHIHLDLLFNQFDGDYDQILEKSKNISDRISPYGGTLEQIEAFQIKLEGLYSAFYDSGGLIEIVLNGGDSDTDETTSGLDTTELNFYGSSDQDSYPTYIYDAGYTGEEAEEEDEFEGWTIVYATGGSDDELWDPVEANSGYTDEELYNWLTVSSNSGFSYISVQDLGDDYADFNNFVDDIQANDPTGDDRAEAEYNMMKVYAGIGTGANPPGAIEGNSEAEVAYANTITTLFYAYWNDADRLLGIINEMPGWEAYEWGED